MKMKSDLIDRLVGILSSAGFQFVDCRGSRSSFDILARCKDVIFLVKALSNIEALNQKGVQELKFVASVLAAVPIVVGERMKSTVLSNGVVYDRYGACVLNPSTFKQLIHNTLPKIYSTRGNYCVRVDSRMLSEMRKRSGLTQEELASRIGVSKQSLYRYEDSGRMSLDVFEDLMDFFEDEGLMLPTFDLHVESPEQQKEKEVDVHLNQLKSIVVRELEDIGFQTSITKAPFDFIASEQERIFTVVSNDWRRLKQKIDMLDEISGVVGGYSVCVSERKVAARRRVLSPSDLKEIKSPRDLFKLLSE